MGAWVRKNYGSGRTSSYYRVGTTAGPVLSGTVTNLAVKAIQTELRSLGFTGTRVDGVFDASTDKAVKDFQTKEGLVVDGIVGPKTATALFSKRIAKAQIDNLIPNDYLLGLVALESGFDPGAVGSNGFDSGLVQINLDPVNGHGKEITQAQAFDPAFAVKYTAGRMVEAFYNYANQLDDLAWKLAVAQHNSPLNAKRWLDAALSTPPMPTEEDSLERIEKAATYVELVDSRIQ
jgi:hypothetical protein